MSNAIITAIKNGSFNLAGQEIHKAGERLSKTVRQAGAGCPNIAALNEVASGYREVAKGKNRLGEYATYLIDGFNSAHPEHPVFWHRNGDAGPGSMAQFHAHPDPAKGGKAEKAPAPAKGGKAEKATATVADAETATATVADAETATDTDTIELDGSMVLEALRLALEGGVVTLAEVEAICLGVAARMAA